MVASEARQMHMGPHLGPPLTPHANVLPGRAFPGPGGRQTSPDKLCSVERSTDISPLMFSWIRLPALRTHGDGCPATGTHSQAEHSQVCTQLRCLLHALLELLNEMGLDLGSQMQLSFYALMLRMEMNAILHQKELENAHQKGLMGMDGPMSYPSNPLMFRGRQRMPDGHDVFVHRPSLDELHSNSILMSASPYPPISTLHRERGRRAGRRPTIHKTAESHVSNLKGQTEDKSVEQSPEATSGEEKEMEVKGDTGEECTKTHQEAKIDPELPTGSRKKYKEGEAALRKTCPASQDGCADVANGSGSEKDISSQCSAFQEKFMYPSAGMPYMFPVPGNGFLPPGKFVKQMQTSALVCGCALLTHSICCKGPPNLFLNGDEAPEDIRKWTVNDVYNFVNGIPTCSEYAQVSFHHTYHRLLLGSLLMRRVHQAFKDHMIDGETLPLLSEEHLLDTLGLKLGPALKIRSQVPRTSVEAHV